MNAILFGKMKGNLILGFVLAVGLAGCANQRDGTSQVLSKEAPPAKVDASESTAMRFIGYGGDAKLEFDKKSLKKDGDDIQSLIDLNTKDKEYGIDGICGARAPGVSANIAIEFAGYLIQDVSSWLVNQADKILQDELNKHTVTITGKSASTDFYKVLAGGNAGLLPTEDRSMCFRMTQVEPVDPKDPKSPPIILADFIGFIHYDHTVRDSLSVQPVRLFLRRIDAPSDDGKVALNVKFSADVSQRQQTQLTNSAGAIDVSVLTLTIDKNSLVSAPLYNYYDPKKTKEVQFPLPPWDYTAVAGDPFPVPRHNNVVGSVTITEVGNAPWILKEVARLLDKNKDSVTKDLVNALDSKAGVPTK